MLNLLGSASWPPH